MVVFAASRWPGLMPDNFSAVYALVFCGGVFLPRKLAWWLPLATLFLTDVALNIHYRHLYEANPEPYAAPMEFFNPYLLANYVSYIALIWLGTKFKPSSKWWKIVGGGVLGAFVFYLLSNSASWLQLPGYAKTFAGWVQALTVGLPGLPPTWMFFLKTLASGGLFAGLFAGAMKFATREAEAKEPETDEDVEPEGVQPEESKA
ncbi:hypothetical protein GC207_07250 [bacterium]|nr:hypothetical protein [bacterium]